MQQHTLNLTLRVVSLLNVCLFVLVLFVCLYFALCAPTQQRFFVVLPKENKSHSPLPLRIASVSCDCVTVCVLTFFDVCCVKCALLRTEKEHAPHATHTHHHTITLSTSHQHVNLCRRRDVTLVRCVCVTCVLWPWRKFVCAALCKLCLCSKSKCSHNDAKTTREHLTSHFCTRCVH